MNSIPRTSGIYQIICSVNNKKYVGSAINLRQRWNDHRKLLRYNKHKNQRLQNSWNIHGESSFDFVILEPVVDINKLIEREQHWIDASNSFDDSFGFNISKTAGSSLGVKHDAQYCERISNRNSKEWVGFINPQGQNVTIRSLWKFCNNNGLHFGAMWNLANGKGRTKSHKGWRFNGNNYTRIIKEYSGFVNPNGELMSPIVGIKKFSEENGLNMGKMMLVYQGKRQSHKGWTHIKNKGDG